MMPVGSASELYLGSLARFFFFGVGRTAAAFDPHYPTEGTWNRSHRVEPTGGGTCQSPTLSSYIARTINNANARPPPKPTATSPGPNPRKTPLRTTAGKMDT
jgi:hypothetical protein